MGQKTVSWLDRCPDLKLSSFRSFTVYTIDSCKCMRVVGIRLQIRILLKKMVYKLVIEGNVWDSILALIWNFIALLWRKCVLIILFLKKVHNSMIHAGACVWILFKKEMNFEFKMHRTGFYLRGIRAMAKGVFLLPPSLLCLFLALLYKRQSLRLYISLQTGPLFEYYTATVYLIKVRNFCINLTLHFEIRKK